MQKKNDRTFTDPTGQSWASKLEWLVYEFFRVSGRDVRRTDKSDTVTYYTNVHQGGCLECGSSEVAQKRTYTPDLYVDESGEEETVKGGYYVECKGYFPGTKRSLLASVHSQHPSLNLRVIFASEVKLTKARTNVQYVKTYIKCPVGIFKNGELVWK